MDFPKEISNLTILQIGSGPWQTTTEIGSGSSILHENLHNYLQTLAGKAYSAYQCAEHHQHFTTPLPNVFVSPTPAIKNDGNECPFPCVYDPLPDSDAIYFDLNPINQAHCLTGVKKFIEESLERVHSATGSYPDVIYIHHASFNALALIDVMEMKKIAIPFCTHLHGTELKAAELYGQSAQQALSRVIDASAQTMYISTDNKDRLLSLVPDVDEGRLVYLPPWLNEDLFFANPDATSADPPKVVLVSRLSEWKRIEALILAGERFIPEEGATIEIIGDGPDRERLETIARKSSVEESITFHGFWDHNALAAYLRNEASLVVNTSPLEPFGLTVIEAMACGVPVIATNRGGPADVLSPAVGALIDDGKTLEEYAERLAATISQALREDWRTTKGETCASEAKQYGIHSREEQFIDVLTETIIYAHGRSHGSEQAGHSP